MSLIRVGTSGYTYPWNKGKPSPCLPNEIITTNNAAYLRLHGSREWYNYLYSEKELDKMLTKIKKLKAKKKAIYLNNDHGMLKNGLYLLQRI